MAKEYPEMKVETLAYWQYFEVPTDDTVPDENVVIRLASSDIDIMHDLNHPNNVKAKAHLERRQLRRRLGMDSDGKRRSFLR